MIKAAKTLILTSTDASCWNSPFTTKTSKDIAPDTTINHRQSHISKREQKSANEDNHTTTHKTNNTQHILSTMKATSSHSSNIHTAHPVINDELAQPRYSLFGERNHGSNGNGSGISYATASVHDVLSDALDIADELDAWIQQIEERRRGGMESRQQHPHASQ